MTDLPVPGTTPPSADTQVEPAGDTATAPSDSVATPQAAVGPTFRLWLPRDVGIASGLLGFPGGFGLVARNAWRIGRRRTALLHLLAGGAILLLILFLPIPRALGIALNFGIAYALSRLVKRQVEVVKAAGGRVDRASGPAGVATFLGGWIALAGPAVAIAVALGTFAPVSPGTMAFGTGGTGCSVDGPLTRSAASAGVHYVASLSREVKAGETIHVALSERAHGRLDDNDLRVDSPADCLNGTIPGGTLQAGFYTFEFTVGAERVATGSVELTP
jgi:hypothetical protein